MNKDRTSPQQKTPVALFDLTADDLSDENLNATVEAIMAALATIRATRTSAEQTPPAPTLPS